MARKTDVTYEAWGNNISGQLGDATTTTRPFPVRVGGSGFGSVKAISAGIYHGVALKTDGTVWTWGVDDNGQIGRSTSETCSTLPCSTSPGQVSELVKIAGIFTRGEHTLVTSTRSAVLAYPHDRHYRLTTDGPTDATDDPI